MGAEPHTRFCRLCCAPLKDPPPPRCEPVSPAPLESFLGRGVVGRALPGLHAFPGHRVGGLPADESWLHLGCHKMFSSSKYGSAGSKWNSELITNGLKSQSHLKNSHIQPARNQGACAVAPPHPQPQTRGGTVCRLRPGDREASPAAHALGDLGPAISPLVPHFPLCKMRDLVTPTSPSGSGIL